jgi:BlaI family penicillinase repressor
MRKSAKDLPRLSVAEWPLMRVLWEHGPMALGDVYARLPADHGWAYDTVKTLVRRLAAKGWIGSQRVGNSFLYSAAVPRSTALRLAVRDFSDRVLDGMLSPFVAYYAESRELSPDDLAQLEKIVDRHRRKGGTKG